MERLPTSGRLGFTWLPDEDSYLAALFDPNVGFVVVDGWRLAVSSQITDAARVAGVPVWASVTGPWGEFSRAVGWDKALIAAAENFRPVWAQLELLEAIHRSYDSLATVLALEAADAIVIADDVASPAGPLVPPEVAHNHFVWVWEKLARMVASAGLPAVFHSDGDMNRFYEELAEAGFVGVHVAAGDDVATIQSAFRAARLNGMVPIGGVPAVSVGDGALLRRVLDLMFAGDCLISDDGGLVTAEQVGEVGRLYLQVCETHPLESSIRVSED